MRITLVRHGQSEANAAQIWQGHGSTPLTDEGRAQAKRLGERISAWNVDLVVSSDIERARDTAAIAGHVPEEDPIWREGDIGGWEGLTEAEVTERYGDELARLRSGEDLRFGQTGESLADVRARARTGLTDLIARLGPDDHAMVVAHGGIIGATVRDVLGLPVTGRYLGLQMNTAVTDIEVREDGSMSITRYADAGHLGGFVGFAARMHGGGAVVVDLIRHGVTDANENGRVQGQMDWGLNDRGRTQARALGAWIGDVDAVYSSPLGRAAETAALAFAGHVPSHHDGLKEIDMGEWEGRDWADVRAEHPEVLHLHDLDERTRRGGGGETYEQLRVRATAAVTELANGLSGPRRVAAISHGGTIGAYVRTLLDLTGPGRRRMGHPANASASRVVFTQDGPLLADYNVSYHLE